MKNAILKPVSFMAILFLMSTNAYSLTKPSSTNLKKGYNSTDATCQGQKVNYDVSANSFNVTSGYAFATISRSINPNPVAYVVMPAGQNITNAVLKVDTDSAIICIKASSAQYNTIYVDGLTNAWTSVAIKYASESDDPRVIQFDSTTDSTHTSENYNSISKDSVAFLGKTSATTYVLTGGGDDEVFGSVETGSEGDYYFIVDAGSGADKIKGSLAQDQLYGGTGHDTIEGMGGYDYIKGGSGNDTIYLNKYKSNNGTLNWKLIDNSESGSVTIQTTTDGDGGEVDGDSGNDTIWGSDGDDLIYGGTGSDLIYGMGGNDELRGEDGNDRLYGMAGTDSLSGGAGTDYLFLKTANDDGVKD